MSLATILLLALVAWMLLRMLRLEGHGGGCGGHPAPKAGGDGTR